MNVGEPHNVEALVVLQPIRVDTASLDEEGQLVLVKGKLVAILVRLDDPDHSATGQWFMEVGLGKMHAVKGRTFETLAAATSWFRQNLKTR